MILLEKIILLSSVSLFKDVSNEILAEIAFNTEIEHVEAGEIIIKKGDIGDILYIIVEGKVAIKEKNQVLTQLTAREIFGELAVLSPEARTASVVATERCVLLKLWRHHLLDILARDINLSMGIIQELCRRIQAMSHQIHKLTQNQAWE